MKRIIWLFILLPYLYGCTNASQNNNKHTLSTQALISFFKTYKRLKRNAENDIVRQNIYNTREQDLVKYIDSIAIFSNLKGRIENIKIEDAIAGNVKILKCNIEISPEEFSKITFKYYRAINNDSLDSDYIYNKMKQISDYSTVYFDGIIAMDTRNKLPYSTNSGEYLAFSYPEYRFHITDIDTSKLNDTINNNLKASLHAGRKCINYLSLGKYEKEKYSEPQFKQLSNEFNELKKSLNKEEKEYVQRYMNSIAGDFN